MVPCASHFTPARRLRLLLEHLDEQLADDLALAFGVLFILERGEETVRRIHPNDPDAEMRGEGLHDLVALAEPEQVRGPRRRR